MTILAGRKNRRWLILCNECGDSLHTYSNIVALWDDASSQGWTSPTDMMHLCPDHTPQEADS